MFLFPEKKETKPEEKHDTIGADPGAAFLDDEAIRQYVVICGLKNVKQMVESGAWRITEKGRQYLKERINDAQGSPSASANS